MNAKFAKLFEDTKYGQILVMVDFDRYGEPKMNFYFKQDNLEIRNAVSGFSGNTVKEQWENADRVFNEMNEEGAVKVVTKCLKIYCPKI